MLAMFVVLFAGYSAVSLGYHGEGRARVGKYNGRVGFGLGKNSLMVRPGMSRIRNNDELRRKFLNAKTPMDLQTCLEDFICFDINKDIPYVDDPEVNEKIKSFSPLEKYLFQANVHLEPSKEMQAEFHKNILNLDNEILFLYRLAQLERQNGAYSELFPTSFIQPESKTIPWFAKIDSVADDMVQDIYDEIYGNSTHLLGGPSITGKQAIDFIYALGMLPTVTATNNLVEDLLQIVDEYARVNPGKIPRKEAVNLLYGLANLAKKYSTGDTKRMTRKKMYKTLTNISESLDPLKVNLGRKLSPKAMESLVNSTRIPSLPALDAAQVLFSLMKCGHFPPKKQCDVLVSKTLSAVGDLDRRGLIESLWALGKIAEEHPGYVDRNPGRGVPRIAVAVLKKMERRFLTDAKWTMFKWGEALFAFTRLRYYPRPEFLTRMFNEIGPISTVMRMTPTHLADLVQTLGKMNYLPPYIAWHDIREAIRQYMPVFSVTDIVKTVGGIAALDKCHRPDVDDIFTDGDMWEMGFEPKQKSLMESLWMRLSRVYDPLLHSRKNLDVSDKELKMFYEGYTYAKLVDERIYPRHVGVMALDKDFDDHLKLKGAHSRLLIHSFKAAQKVEKEETEYVDHQLVEDISTALSDLGMRCEYNIGINIYNSPIVAIGDPRDDNDLDRSPDTLQAPSDFRFAVIFTESRDYFRNNGARVRGGLRERILREYEYEPIFVNLDTYRKLGQNKRNTFLQKLAREAGISAALQRRIKNLKLQQRLEGDPYIEDEYKEFVGERLRPQRRTNLPEPETRDHAITFGEYLKDTRIDYKKLAEEDEIPTKRYSELHSTEFSTPAHPLDPAWGV